MGTTGVFTAEAISQLVGGLACSLTMYFTVYRPLGRLPDRRRRTSETRLPRRCSLSYSHRLARKSGGAFGGFSKSASSACSGPLRVLTNSSGPAIIFPAGPSRPPAGGWKIPNLLGAPPHHESILCIQPL